MRSYRYKVLSDKIELTIIISYYKAIDNLKLILKALDAQSVGGFEVIISEDDNNSSTVKFVADNRDIFSFPIIHLNQEEDNGFRKNSMLNKSINASNSNKLVFLDGDCVPHKHLAREYIRNIDDNHFFIGRSVMLSEKASELLLEGESLEILNLSKLSSLGSTNLKDGIYFPFFPLIYKLRGLLGRNWGVSKKSLIAVNGFDEDYILAGVGEDTDVEWRLKGLGLKGKSMKNKAIVYHIYHPRNYSEEDVQKNTRMMEQKQLAGNIRCLNGLKNN